MTRRRSPWSVGVAGVLVLVAAGIGGIAAAADPPARLFGLPGAGLAAVIGLPSGLSMPGVRRPTFLPWAAVQDGFLHRIPHQGGMEPYVAVSVSDAAAIKTSRAGWLLHAANRRFGGDLYIPARIMATELELLVHAIDVYSSSPERRQAIGTAGELERLRSEWTGPVPARGSG
jgi:hypothetical protein